jgi:hypothetical protein
MERGIINKQIKTIKAIKKEKLGVRTKVKERKSPLSFFGLVFKTVTAEESPR